MKEDLIYEIQNWQDTIQYFKEEIAEKQKKIEQCEKWISECEVKLDAWRMTNEEKL